MSLRRTRLIVVAAVTVASAGVAVAGAQSAQAAPVYPTGAHLTAVSHSAIRVGLNKVANTTKLHVTSYRLVASTVKADVVTSYLNAHGFKSTYSGSARTNSVLISGMRYTTAPYYYRVGITYSEYPKYVAWGATYSSGFGLAPNAPTAVASHIGAAGRYLTWTAPSGGSTGASIYQTNTRTGTTATYTIHNTTAKFTPYGLGVGTPYSYRVRAINIATHSAASASAASLTGVATAKLRVMSYNILGAVYTADVSQGKTLKLAGWAQRVSPAAALVVKTMPDVLDIQEGDTILGSDGTSHPGNHAYPTTGWPGNWSSTTAAKNIAAAKHVPCNTFYKTSNPVYKGTAHYWPYRQADSLCDYTNKLLGASTYTRAVDGTYKHNGSTNYLIYNTRTMAQLTAAQLGVSTSSCWGSDDRADTVPTTTASAVRCGGYWSLDDTTGYESTTDAKTKPTERSAAWAAFTLKSNGTKVLMVSPHISVETGPGWDARRTAQVRNMVSLAQAKARALRIGKIIYAGDFNNYVGRPGIADVTTAVMKAAGYPDSVENAQHSYNTKYLSGNQYLRSPLETPSKLPGYVNLDHIYIYPGIAVQSFGEALNLNSKGQFADAAIPSDHNPVWADLFVTA